MEPFRSVCEPPSLMMVFASLGGTHATRHGKTGRRADLKEAISATRIALSISAADDPLSPTLLNNLGSLLLRRHLDLGEQDDLDLALYYTRQALDFISVDDKKFSLVLATIGTARAARYDWQDNFADLEVAICKIQESLELRPKDETLHISLFNNLGALLWRRYRLTGRPQELDESIVYLSKALEGISENTAERVTCLINCGFAFIQRYRLVEQLGDLSSALRHAQEAMQLDPSNPHLGALLGGLDTFLEHRCDHALPQRTAKSPWFGMPAVLGFTIFLTYLLFMALFHWIGISQSILLTLSTFLAGAVGKWVVDQCVFRSGGNLNPRPPFASVLKIGTFITTGRGKADDYVPKILPAPLIAVPYSSTLRGSGKMNAHREQPLERSPKPHSAQKHQDRLMEHWRRLSVTKIDQGCRASRGTYSSDRRHLHPERHSTSMHRTSRLKSKMDMTFVDEHVETGQDVLGTAGSEPCRSTKEAGLFVQRVVAAQEPSDFSTSAQDANIACLSNTDICRHRSNVVIENAYEPDHEVQPQLQRSQVHAPEPPQRDTENPAPVDSLETQDEPSPTPEKETQPLQESEYPEHRIWHDVPSSGAKKTSLRRTSVIYQGDTTHAMVTNEGLAMGNVSGERTEIVGHVRYGDNQSMHSDLLYGDRVEPTELNQGTSSTISKTSRGISCTSINSSPSQKSMSEDGMNSPPKLSIPNVESINSDDDEKEDQQEREARPTIYQDVSSETSIEENGESEYDDCTEEDERKSEEWDEYSEHDVFRNRARELDRYSLSAEEEDAEDEAEKGLVDDSVRAYMESLGLEL